MENSIEKATVHFIEEIRKSDIYKEYDYQKEELKRQPELFEKVLVYRQENYEIQNNTSEEDMFDRMDAFEKKYEKFLEIPLVDNFLQAEVAFCRMMQEINVRITTDLDFE